MMMSKTVIHFGSGFIGVAGGPLREGVYGITMRLLNEELPIGDIPDDKKHVYASSNGNDEVMLVFHNLESLKEVVDGMNKSIKHFERQLATEEYRKQQAKEDFKIVDEAGKELEKMNEG